jgi:hypothetical protein
MGVGVGVSMSPWCIKIHISDGLMIADVMAFLLLGKNPEKK